MIDGEGHPGLASRAAIGSELGSISQQETREKRAMNQPRAIAWVLLAVSAFHSTASAAELTAPKLYVLLAIDTLAPHATELGIPVDGAKMISLLATLYPDKEVRDEKLALTVLSGEKLTRAAILEYYRNLLCKPNDAVMFYYSGHGGSKGNPDTGNPLWTVEQRHQFAENRDEYFDKHYLAISRSQTMLRTDLRAAMRQKQCRLAIIITDCCATYEKGGLGRGDDTRAVLEKKNEELRLAPIPIAQPRAFKMLLNDYMGVLDVTSAKAGTAALGATDGGHFTTAFIAALGQNDRLVDDFLQRIEKKEFCDHNALWWRFFDNTRGELHRKYGEKYPEPKYLDGTQQAYERFFDDELGLWIYRNEGQSFGAIALWDSKATKAGMPPLIPIDLRQINSQTLYDIRMPFAQVVTVLKDAKRSGKLSIHGSYYTTRTGVGPEKRYDVLR